jgi:glycolate oxidase
MDKEILQKIQSLVGTGNCLHTKEAMACYGYDASASACLPDVVVFPGNTQEISSLVTLANETGIPVTPRGSGTGTTGGCIAVKGGMVLVTTRMNRILKIDTDNLVAHVEPGVMTGRLHDAVEAQGLYYPPDPASARYSTIGGNLGECAGGPRAVKYGVTRDYVLGLEAVIGTGEIIRTGVQTAKGVVGYDLTRLMVGSEGTLGIITRIILRLLPRPETVRTLLALFPDMAPAAETVSEIIRRGLTPRTIEFMDRASIQCVSDQIDPPLPREAGALLIIEADGTPGETDNAVRQLAAVCRERGALSATVAGTEAEAENLWQARKALSPAMYQYGPDKMNEDIVVPRSRIPEMLRYVEALQAETGLTMICFGHAGDGNIHFHIMLDKSVAADLAKAEAAVEKVFDKTLALGGSISGEHGVGLSKQPYLSKEIGGVEQRVMQQIKQVFDPRGILNPGKIFPATGEAGI